MVEFIWFSYLKANFKFAPVGMFLGGISNTAKQLKPVQQILDIFTAYNIELQAAVINCKSELLRY